MALRILLAGTELRIRSDSSADTEMFPTSSGPTLASAHLVSWGLISVLVVAPLLRGCWDVWAQTIIQCAVVAGFTLWSVSKLLREKSSGSVSRTILCLGGLALLGWISYRRSSYPFSARGGLWNLWTGLCLFLLALRTQRVRFHRLVSYGYSASGLILSVIAILQATAMAKLVGWASVFSNGVPGIASVLVNPNVLAGVLILTVPMSAALFYSAWKAQSRVSIVFSGMTLTASLFSLVLTRSVLACVALGAVGALYLAQYSVRHATLRRIHRCWLIGISALIGLIMIGVVGLKFMRSTAETTSPTHVSNRMVWWRTAVVMWWDHPWIGVGPESYGEAYPHYRGKGLKHSLYAHNAYLQLLAECGLFGALGFGALVIGAVFGFKRQWSNIDRQAQAVGLGALLLQNIGDFGLHFPGVSWPVMILLGDITFETPWIRIPNVAPVFRKCLIIPIFASSALLFNKILDRFTASRYLTDGATALERSDPQKALRFAQEGIKLDPMSPELFALSGISKLQLKDVSSAQGDFEKATILSPYSARFHAQRALGLEEAGDLVAAEQEMQEAIHLHPERAIYLFQLGQLYERHGRRHEAVAVYQKLIESPLLKAYRGATTLHPDELEEKLELERVTTLAIERLHILGSHS